ncbi:hypothetical protein PMIN02_000006 [Paraphaeosphaeria minitans]
MERSGKHIGATKLSAYTTIEAFKHGKGAKNNVATVGHGAFVVTKDDSKTFKLRKRLDKYISGGVTYCSSTSTCVYITPPQNVAQ